MRHPNPKKTGLDNRDGSSRLYKMLKGEERVHGEPCVNVSAGSTRANTQERFVSPPFLRKVLRKCREISLNKQTKCANQKVACGVSAWLAYAEGTAVGEFRV